MKSMKSGIIFALTLGLIGNPQYAQAFDIEDAKCVAGYAAIGVITTGIGYGCYRLHETISLYNANNRLKYHEIDSAAIAQHPHHAISLNEQELVNSYYNNINEYAKLCGEVNRDVRMLTEIQSAVDTDIYCWATTDRAHAFLAQARSFSDLNNQRLQQLTPRATFLNKQMALIRLARLIDEETRASTYHLVNASARFMLDESTARGYNAQSAWPLRTAWKSLDERKQLYQQCVNEYAPYNAQVDYVKSIMQAGLDTIAAYDQAQRTIAGFSSYTNDLRAEKDFELREEQARQAKIQAEAARIAAIAQERQAVAQEKQIRQQKENELITLRSELSALKQRIANGDDSYYIRQQKVQLQNRINNIKTELYGPSSWGSFFCDVITDQD
ncbi:MAG: hypothetical protein P4L31_03685 [Candidatus Babeliales bacterium]|nr:hypothetical protein [Candidatus Babeliales bacterium]